MGPADGACLLVDGLQALWAYKSPTCAGRFLDAWCRRAMRSRLDPINGLVKLRFRKTFFFRTFTPFGAKSICR